MCCQCTLKSVFVLPGVCVTTGAGRGDAMISSAVDFIQAYARKLERKAGCSLVLGLLCFQRSSPTTQVSMPAVLQCTVAAAQAMPSEAFEEASNQWHAAVLAELKQHLRSAANECSSLMLGVQTGENTAPVVLPAIVYTFCISKHQFMIQP